MLKPSPAVQWSKRANWLSGRTVTEPELAQGTFSPYFSHVRRKELLLKGASPNPRQDIGAKVKDPFCLLSLRMHACMHAVRYVPDMAVPPVTYWPRVKLKRREKV